MTDSPGRDGQEAQSERPTKTARTDRVPASPLATLVPEAPPAPGGIQVLAHGAAEVALDPPVPSLDKQLKRNLEMVEDTERQVLVLLVGTKMVMSLCRVALSQDQQRLAGFALAQRAMEAKNNILRTTRGRSNDDSAFWSHLYSCVFPTLDALAASSAGAYASLRSASEKELDNLKNWVSDSLRASDGSVLWASQVAFMREAHERGLLEREYNSIAEDIRKNLPNKLDPPPSFVVKDGDEPWTMSSPLQLREALRGQLDPKAISLIRACLKDPAHFGTWLEHFVGIAWEGRGAWVRGLVEVVRPLGDSYANPDDGTVGAASWRLLWRVRREPRPPLTVTAIHEIKDLLLYRAEDPALTSAASSGKLEAWLEETAGDQILAARVCALRAQGYPASTLIRFVQWRAGLGEFKHGTFTLSSGSSEGDVVEAALAGWDAFRSFGAALKSGELALFWEGRQARWTAAARAIEWPPRPLHPIDDLGEVMLAHQGLRALFHPILVRPCLPGVSRLVGRHDLLEEVRRDRDGLERDRQLVLDWCSHVDWCTGAREHLAALGRRAAFTLDELMRIIGLELDCQAPSAFSAPAPQEAPPLIERTQRRAHPPRNALGEALRWARASWAALVLVAAVLGIVCAATWSGSAGDARTLPWRWISWLADFGGPPFSPALIGLGAFTAVIALGAPLILSVALARSHRWPLAAIALAASLAWVYGLTQP